jgi:hypothetical protein
VTDETHRHPPSPGPAAGPGRADDPETGGGPGTGPADGSSGGGPADGASRGGPADGATGGSGDPREDATGSGGDRTPPGPEDRPSHRALERVARDVAPPRPPRRTGVFVDHEELREHVGGLLRAILGGYEVDAFGNFTFVHEHARVVVTVGPSPIGPQVGVFCVTNLDLDLTPQLARFLLTTNHTLGFGSFSYDPGNRAVWLRHSLLGTTLDLPELQAAVAAVATTAAELDHTIQERFGGRTFAEAPSDVQQRMEPPEPAQGGRPNASGYL